MELLPQRSPCLQPLVPGSGSRAGGTAKPQEYNLQVSADPWEEDVWAGLVPPTWHSLGLQLCHPGTLTSLGPGGSGASMARWPCIGLGTCSTRV